MQKQFPLSVFVFIDSLVVSASQDQGGHALFRQNNLTFGISLHVVGVRTAVCTLLHKQFSAVERYCRLLPSMVYLSIYLFIYSIYFILFSWFRNLAFLFLASIEVLVL